MWAGFGWKVNGRTRKGGKERKWEQASTMAPKT